MYVRCSDCLASTWAELIEPAGLASAFTCRECGRSYTIDPIEDLGPTVGEHYRRALAHANGSGFDFASSYAILLGIMSVDQAQILRHSRPTELLAQPEDELTRMEAEVRATEEAAREPRPPAAVESRAPHASRPAAGESAPRPSRRQAVPPGPVEARPVRAGKLDLGRMISDFDLGFLKSIQQGHMTIQQAMMRGERDAFAARLMRRHRLPESTAYAVTDNRISLGDALERKKRSAAATGSPAEREGSRHRRFPVPTALFALGIGLLGLSAVIWSGKEQPPPREAAAADPHSAPATSQDGAETDGEEARSAVLLASTRVRADGLGRVIQIIGPDPTSVLRAFCESTPSALGLEPVEVTSAVPESQNARLGLFRDFSAPGSLYAIRMRKDGQTGSWVAGSGVAPVQVGEAPRLPDGATRIAVNR
jgi:hypothetical protein